jgi:phospho-N-acetylmuramoyl-pentapeptide-transferase
MFDISQNQNFELILNLTRLDMVKFIVPMLFAFIFGMFSAAPLADFLYKHKLWRKKSATKAVDGSKAPLSHKLHNDAGRKVPRMGGLVVVAGVLLTAGLLYITSYITHNPIIGKLNFVSRGQTWIPLIGFIVGALVGFVDDLIVCGKFRLFKLNYVGGGLSLKLRLAIISLVALLTGWWIVVKQEVSSTYFPFIGEVHFNPAIFFIIVFVLIISTYASNIIDGVDGLAGGVFGIIYITLGLIAVLQTKYDIATLCFVTSGAIFAFLWFNIPPARFFMSEVGSTALTVMMGIIVVSTNTIVYFPIIGLPLVITVLSTVAQIISKKVFKKKIFIVAPLHNHLQLKGWPNYKVAMRYWIVSVMSAIGGLVLYIVTTYA